MSVETLFGIASKTKQFKIYLDNILLKTEDVVNFEMKFDMFSPFVYGVLIYRDSYSMSNSNVIKISEENTIKVIITDRYNDTLTISFKPLDIDYDDTAKRERKIIIKLLDIVSMKLLRKTNSKSFNGKITDAFKSEYNNICSEVGINMLTISEKNSCDSENIISPSDTNEFDFFSYRLEMQGIACWRSHTSLNLKEINVKNFDDLSGTVTYNTEISNNANIFKIYQFNRKNSSKNTIPVPTIKYTNTLGKTQKTDVVTVQELVNNVELNGNGLEFISPDVSNTVEVTNSNGIKNEKFKQLKLMLKNNQLIIFVSGSLIYGNVGNIVNVKIGSKSPYKEQQLSGDPTASGKYVITSVVDKFLGTKFAQKITLSRFDNPKPLKV